MTINTTRTFNWEVFFNVSLFKTKEQIDKNVRLLVIGQFVTIRSIRLLVLSDAVVQTCSDEKLVKQRIQK